jgi:PAS domain S-box-containing protein
MEHITQGMVVVGRDYQVLAFNRPFIEILQLPVGAVQVGADFRQLVKIWAEVTGQDQQMLDHAIAQLDMTDPFEFEFSQLIGGAPRWCLLAHNPMPGRGFVRTFTDITERKGAEQILRDSRARLQRAEKVASFGNWELDLKEMKMHGSPGARGIYGVEDDAWTLADIQSLPLPEYREMLDRALSELIERQEPYNVEFRIRRQRDGQLRDIHSMAEYEPDRRVVFGVLHDITERKDAERQQRYLETQLMQSQKMESLGSLAGGVAHDMNNVLGAILAVASASLAARPGTLDDRSSFAAIIKAAERGGKMVKSLLGLARKSPAEEQELDMNGIIQEAAALLERTTLSRICIRKDLAADLRTMRGDAGALSHTVMNLCLNAVDAMPGQGTLALHTRNAGRDWIEVVVQDNGTGMPRATLEKAMDPFFTTKEHGKGTGLGLSMAYSTVKAHLGRIEIQSEPGQGTRVTMRFPACARPLESAPAPEPPQARAQAALSVLLVDDDELVLSSLTELLGVLGHRVTQARCGEEALERIESGLDPDGVILDVNMPGLGGIGTLPRLRALRPAMPVILTTGRPDPGVQRLMEAHQPVSLLPKPFSLKELRDSLDAFSRTD